MSIELLAPAGSKEAFIGAINAGCNAVYIAGKNYGARKYASNFSNAEIKEMISYAHLRNVKVFVTVNTIIFEEELNQLLNYTDFLVQHHVDALIVQDIGVIEELVRRYPNTEIHASTQLNTYNKEQLQYLKDIGVSRVILARETGVDVVKKMKQDIDIDLEVFVHGALCVSFSGNCLMSFYKGGRSGNRGECAQPCRLKYDLEKDNRVMERDSYLLSTKDLMTIDYLKEVVDSGVSSLKIEGRMKKPAYVIATIRAYREALDAIEKGYDFDIQKRINELLIVFNREYTKGYLLEEEPSNINNAFRPNHQGIEVGKVTNFKHGKVTIDLTGSLCKNDGIRFIGTTDIGGKVSRILKQGEVVEKANNEVIQIDMKDPVEVGSVVMKTLDYNLEQSLEKYLSETYKLVPLSGTLELNINQPVKLVLRRDNIDVKLESEFIIQKANKPNQNTEKMYNQFNKLGNTIYYLDDFSVFCEDDIFVPNSVINDLRRTAIEKLEEAYLTEEPRMIKPVEHQDIKTSYINEGLICKVETLDQLKACEELGIKEIYVSENITQEQYPTVYNRIQEFGYKNYSEVILNDVGLLHKTFDFKAINYPMNVVNSLSLYYLSKKDVDVITLSVESTFDNTKKMIDVCKRRYHNTPNLELIVYGKVDAMISKYCPITKSEGIYKRDCNLCLKHNYSLRNGSSKYPMIKDGGCNIRIINNSPIQLKNEIRKYHNIGIRRFRLDFTNESKQETINIIKKYQSESEKL